VTSCKQDPCNAACQLITLRVFSTSKSNASHLNSSLPFITLVTVAPSYPVPGLLKRSLLPCPNFTATRIPTTTSSFRFASRLANNLSREYAVTPKPSPLYLLPLSRSSLQLTTVSVRTLKMPPNSKQATLGYVKNPQLTLGWVGGVQCLLYLS
jgi:hypothetical protein